MQEVEAVCDRVIIINKGKIVADDDTSLLRSKAGDAAVIIVEFDRQVQRNRLSGIPGVRSAAIVDGNIWKLTSGAGTDIRPAVFKFAVDEQLTVLSLSRESQSLEGIFRQLTST
jgi:ABC-2 type transport system ATP-binding protein